MKDANERASGVVERDWEVEAHRSQVSWTARTGRMIGITTDGIDCGPFAYSLLNQSETLSSSSFVDASESTHVIRGKVECSFVLLCELENVFSKIPCFSSGTSTA